MVMLSRVAMYHIHRMRPGHTYTSNRAMVEGPLCNFVSRLHHGVSLRVRAMVEGHISHGELHIRRPRPPTFATRPSPLGLASCGRLSVRLRRGDLLPWAELLLPRDHLPHGLLPHASHGAHHAHGAHTLIV